MTPAAPGPTGPTPVKAPKPVKDTLPAGEQELATLAGQAADAWNASPLPALLWCSKAELRTAATAFQAGIGTADAAGDPLSPAAARLAELDALVDASLKFVKNHLTEAHGSKTAGQAYYGAFGMAHRGAAWGLRTARPARVEDLTKLVAALKASDYDKGKYGTAYWQALLTEYAPLAATSSNTRAASAKQTGAKNVQEAPLRQMLRVLRSHIKNNFPATYAAEWRSFGYLRESY